MEERSGYFQYFVIINNATINNLLHMLFQICDCLQGKISTSEIARVKGKCTQLDEINCFDQLSAIFKRKCLI